jgi:[acyl-carrier-protein] S-malonyltransferase
LTLASELQQDIRAQMQSRVRWTETVQLLVGQGVTTFVEVGTGNVLIGLVRRIASSATGYPLGNPADFTALS